MRHLYRWIPAIVSVFTFLSLLFFHGGAKEEPPGEITQRDPALDPLMSPMHLLISPISLCSNNKTIIIVVHSSGGNFLRRDVIRQTYGAKEWREKFGFEVIFVVGRTPYVFYDEWIRQEAERFGDILQGDFSEDYRNLTVKAMLWLRFTANYCSSSTSIMHLDDDIIIDLFSIMHNFFGVTGKPKDINTIYCLSDSVLQGAIRRNEADVWYVPMSAYNSTYFPIYCGGAAYVIPTAVLPSLIANLEKRPYISTDDALITGIARSECGVKIKQVIPKSLIEQHPVVVLERFRQRKVIVADCTERCSVEAWRIVLSHYHNRTDPVTITEQILSI